MKKQVINSKNLPSKFPFAGTLSIILALSYWNAPQWLWGAFIVLLILVWVGVGINLYREKQIDIFKNQKR